MPPSKSGVRPFLKERSIARRNLKERLMNRSSHVEVYSPFKKQNEPKKRFTFGLYDHSSNFDIKNKEKLMLFHDFLWKINYSNNLFVKPS